MRTQKTLDLGSYDNTAIHGTEPSPEILLRRQAEIRVGDWEELSSKVLEFSEVPDLGKSRRLLRELRVYQIELEIQNEELRLSQQELELSQIRYRDLYDFAPVGYITVSEAGLILEANTTAADLLREVNGTLVGQPVSHFILPDDQDVYYHHRAAILETEERQSCKLRLLRKAQPPFWARLETVPTRKWWANPTNTCRIMFSDISNGVRAAQEKKQLEDQCRQLEKAESLGRMAGAIAHHFNNLLGVMIGNLELTIDDLPSNTDTHGYAQSAMEAARRAAEMSASMLTYLGQTIVSHQPIDLAATSRTSLEKLRAFLPQDLTLVVDLPSVGPTINANTGQVELALKKMVTNAWESLPKGKGTVRVSVRTTEAVHIPRAHRFPGDWQMQEASYACLEVADTGCGLETEEMDKIFDPFFTSKFLGRGLGLPIVMGVVRAHNGVVTVTSKKGRGSVFSAFFPIDTKTLAATLEKNTVPTGISTDGAILVIDDEPMVRDIAKASLNRIGYKVLVARDGNEAVQLFRQHQVSISCVLCDLVMPGMDGWETLSALRRLDPDIAVILSSGYDQVNAMAGDHADLPQSFLGKPYDLAELQEAIREAMLKRGKVQPASPI